MAGGGSFTSDQTTLQMDTASVTLLRAASTRITSIQGEGIAGSQLLLHDAAATGDTAAGNLKATYNYGTEGLFNEIAIRCIQEDWGDNDFAPCNTVELRSEFNSDSLLDFTFLTDEVTFDLTKNYKSTAGCVAMKEKDFLIMLKIINKKTKIRIN